MELLTTEHDSKPIRPQARRSVDDGPPPGKSQRTDQEAEPLFDIADFEAIASFAGIRPGLLKEG